MATLENLVFDEKGNMLPSYRAAVEKNAEASTVKPPTSLGQGAAKLKAPIVTKEQLEKSDFTNLRDYLNDQKGLKRRDGKAPKRKSDGSGSASSSKTAEQPKGKTASEYSRDTDEMRNLTRQKAAVMAFPSAVYDTDTDRMRNQSRKEARFEGAKRMANTPEGKAKEAARLKQMEKDQALQRVTPELALIGGGTGVGLKTMQTAAKKLAGTGSKNTASAGAKTRERIEPTFKRGGKVHGSAASKRGDGIALRGKTRGKMY